MEEWVEFTSSGSKLVGILALPESTARVPRGVVFIHGWGGNRIGPHRIIVKVARALARQGVASLRFDLRGRGDSEGDPDAATLDRMIEDTCAAIDLLRRRTNLDHVNLWGICSGGNVAIGAATLKPDVTRMVLLSTLPFIPQKKASEKVARTKKHAFGYLRKLVSLKTWKKLVSGAVDFGGIRKTLFGHYGHTDERDRKDSARDIMKAFRSYQGDALFVYGGADPEAVDAQTHYDAFTRENDIPARFVTIDGSNHDFYSIAWENEITKLTADWIEKP